MTTKTINFTREQAKAIQCAGTLLEYCVNDPGPAAQDKYQTEFNCANCNWHGTCVKVLEAISKS